jgi:transcriptional regulator with XRE-family HTH domain
MSDTTPVDPLRKAIGQRLSEERVGLKLSQQEFGESVGKSRRAVAAWEAGEQSPDAHVLAQAAQAGLDVLYVVTGRRGGQLSEPQQLLVSYTSGMDTMAVKAALMAMRGFAAYATDKPELLDPPSTLAESPNYGGATMTFHGDVNQAAGRDVNVHSPVFQEAKNIPTQKQPTPKKSHK